MADQRSPHEKALNTSLTSPDQDAAKHPGEDRPPPVQDEHRVERAGAPRGRPRPDEPTEAQRRRGEDRKGTPMPSDTGRALAGGDAAGATTQGPPPAGTRPFADYDQFLDAVRKLPFITRDVKADEAVKCVLGVLASKLPVREAGVLTKHLPAPLTLEKLRSHQARPTRTSAEDYFTVVAKQLNLPEEDATRLIQTVLHAAVQTMDEEDRAHLAAALPEDWRAIVSAA